MVMPIFPGDLEFRAGDALHRRERGLWLNKTTIGEHSGTHWGSPCHFNVGERRAEDMAAEDFFHRRHRGRADAVGERPGLRADGCRPEAVRAEARPHPVGMRIVVNVDGPAGALGRP